MILQATRLRHGRATRGGRDVKTSYYRNSRQTLRFLAFVPNPSSEWSMLECVTEVSVLVAVKRAVAFGPRDW